MNEILGLIADVIGILGDLFALLAWLKARQIQATQVRDEARNDQLVEVKLQHGAQSYALPVSIRRAELSRAEVLGRLGSAVPRHNKKGHFSIDYLSLPDFFKQLDQIRQGTVQGILTIPLEEDEWEQFNI